MGGLEIIRYPPAGLVKLRDGQGRERKVVGQKDQMLLCFGVDGVNASEDVWIILKWVEPSQADGLIGTESGGFVYCLRRHVIEFHVS